MKADYDTHFNLAERIGNTFPEIDNDICMDLRQNDSEYAKMDNEFMKMQRDFPTLTLLTEGEATTPITLSLDERKALVRYLSIKNEMENYERKKIYFRGHTDCVAYLVKVAGIHIG